MSDRFGSTLILMKHGAPRIQRQLPAAEWTLTSDGARAIRRFAASLVPGETQWIASSHEPKARQTADIVGLRLQLPVLEHTDLKEQDNHGIGFLEYSEFKRRVKALLEQPERRFGVETGIEAATRFHSALESLAARQRGAGIVVSHGRVITLFVGQHNKIDPYAFWEKLEFGGIIRLSVQNWELVDA